MKTAEQIIQDIEAMKVRGAHLITQTALEALVLRAKESALQGGQACRASVLAAAERLIASQPSMAVVRTGCRFVTSLLLERGEDELTAPEIERAVATRAAIFTEYMQVAQAAVSAVGAALVEDGCTICVISYSSTVIGMLRKAWENGKRFSVIGTESRPYCEGRAMAAALVEVGVSYTLITDAALAATLPRADFALIGVDTLLATGAVINKMGTLPLALACRYYGKPLYAACSSFKFSTVSQQGEKVNLKVVEDNAGIAPAELLGHPRLKVENVFFEPTPARYFEGLITEYGVQPPAMAPMLWERTWGTLTKAIDR